MITEVKVPSVGESVTSGVVSAWHKKSGDFVNEGEPLFALETDKVSTDIVAEKSGVLETKVPEGQEVKIGEVVAIIDDSKQTGEKKATEPKKAEKAQQKKKEESEGRKSEPEPGKKGVEKEEKAAPHEGRTSFTCSPPNCRGRAPRAGENSWHRYGRPFDQGRRADSGSRPQICRGS